MVSNKMGTLKELGLQMPESFRELSLEDRPLRPPSNL